MIKYAETKSLNIEPDKNSQDLENDISATKALSLPALYIQGELDGVNPPYVSENVHKKFTGEFNRFILPGVGHFPSREVPEILAGLLVKFLNTK